MEVDVSVRISNRHVHLTEDVYKMLFNEEMNVKNYLNQVGQFASDKTLTISVGDKKIENVRIVGPYRSYNQVEISKRDARGLGVNPPVRQSGDLADSLPVTLTTDKGSVEVKGLIIAARHVHMNYKDAEKYNVVNGQNVKLKISGDKGAIMDAQIKVSADGYYEAHIDTDDANATLLENDDVIKLII